MQSSNQIAVVILLPESAVAAPNLLFTDLPGIVVDGRTVAVDGRPVVVSGGTVVVGGGSVKWQTFIHDEITAQLMIAPKNLSSLKKCYPHTKYI